MPLSTGAQRPIYTSGIVYKSGSSLAYLVAETGLRVRQSNNVVAYRAMSVNQAASQTASQSGITVAPGAIERRSNTRRVIQCSRKDENKREGARQLQT